MQRQYVAQQELNATTNEETEKFHETIATVHDLRDKIANFDEFFRPLRNYFYWELHCFDMPICRALRSIFDALDGIDELAGVTTGQPAISELPTDCAKCWLRVANAVRAG